MSLIRVNSFLCTHSSQPPSVLSEAIVRGSQLPPRGIYARPILSNSMTLGQMFQRLFFGSHYCSNVAATLTELNSSEDQYGDGVPSGVSSLLASKGKTGA